MYLGYVLAIRLPHHDAVDGDVEHIGPIEERIPKPRKILPGYVLDRAEKIRGRWMFERPTSYVLAHCAIHCFPADDVVAQREKHSRRFSVADSAESVGVDAIRRS